MPVLCSREKEGPVSAVDATEENMPWKSGVDQMEGSTTVEYASPMARKVAVRPDLYTIEEVSEEEEKAAELSLDKMFEDSEMESELNNFTPVLQHCAEDTDTVCKETLPDTTVLPTETWSPLDESRQSVTEKAVLRPTYRETAARRRQRRNWKEVSQLATKCHSTHTSRSSPPNPGRFLQALNTSPITTFGTCPFSLWTSVSGAFSLGSSSLLTSPVPNSVQISSPLSIFWSTAVSPVYTTRLPTSLSGSSLPFDASRQLAVLDPETENSSRQLLAKYPGLTPPNFNASIPPHDVAHHIRTIGPFSRPRSLAPARFAAAKVEFDHMLQMGIVRQSESAWASILHMVPKAATGGWRP
nr:unnamed protein product [Spirometra erinaceieuropaei]